MKQLIEFEFGSENLGDVFVEAKATFTKEKYGDDIDGNRGEIRGFVKDIEYIAYDENNKVVNKQLTEKDIEYIENYVSDNLFEDEDDYDDNDDDFYESLNFED